MLGSGADRVCAVLAADHTGRGMPGGGPYVSSRKSGDRVKTDRRDAEKLARCHRAGELTAVWVPDAAHEALRDLVRAREAAKKDQLRAKHRLSKFLLRHGHRQPDGRKAWTKKHLEWIKAHVHFEHAALEARLGDYFHEIELTAGGKKKNQTVTAVGRELLGFIWHIALKTEQAQAA